MSTHANRGLSSSAFFTHSWLKFLANFCEIPHECETSCGICMHSVSYVVYVYSIIYIFMCAILYSSMRNVGDTTVCGRLKMLPMLAQRVHSTSCHFKAKTKRNRLLTFA